MDNIYMSLPDLPMTAGRQAIAGVHTAQEGNGHEEQVVECI